MNIRRIITALAILTLTPILMAALILSGVVLADMAGILVR